MPRTRRDALTLFVLCFVVYLAFAKGRPWVEASYQVDRSRLLLQDGTLGSAAPIAEFDIRGIDGRYYDVHGLLNTFVHVPFVALDPLLGNAGPRARDASAFISSMSGVVINSLTVMAFYILLSGLGIARAASLTATIALAFGTMMFPYSGTNYEGNADILCLVLASHYCFAFLRAAPETRARLFGWCGFWCGAALLGRESNFVLVGLIGIAVLFTKETGSNFGNYSRSLFRFAVALLPFVLLLGWFNWIRTGTPFETAITYRIGAGYYPFFEVKHPYGIVALLLSPGGSIFVYSPMALLALCGVRALWRRFPREAVIGTVFTMVTLVSSGVLPKWFGLSGWGPRYLNPTLPFLLVALAVWLDAADRDERARRRRHALTIAFLIPALAMQCAGALVNWAGRLSYVLRHPGGGELERWNGTMFTVSQSQWWDAITTLCANISHMITGRYPADTIAQLPLTISASSRYTTLTLDTWWNRLVFEGLPPFVAVIYLAASAAVVTLCIASLRRQRA